MARATARPAQAAEQPAPARHTARERAPAGPAGAGGSPVGCAGKAAVAGETNQTVQIGTTSRTYILHIPSSYTGQSAVPLVLDFHPLGGTGSSEKSLSGFAAPSDSEGFIIAWPDGIDNAWNIGPCCTNSRTVDDRGFAKGMVAAVESSACIDPKRVYSTGFSMGGGMSHYLACNARSASSRSAAPPTRRSPTAEGQGHRDE